MVCGEIRKAWKPLFLTACAFTLSPLGPPAAEAADINVDVVGSPSDEAPPDANGNCTLREAVNAARLNTPVDGCGPGEGAALDRIHIPSGLVELAGAAGEDANLSGDLDINGGGPLSVIGSGGGNTEIQAAPNDRAFDLISGETSISGISGYGGAPTGAGGFVQLASGATLNLSASSLTGNVALGGGGRGGAISGPAGSTISVDGSALESNTAQAADAGAAGGAIYSDGKLTVTNSDINANQATGLNAFSGGGAIAATGAVAEGRTATIRGSRIIGNSTIDGRFGGGIYFGKGFQTASYEVDDTIVQGNTATFAGGGIDIQGANSLYIDGSTIQDNHMPNQGVGGGGIGAAQNNPTDEIVITDSAFIGNDLTGTDVGNGFGGAAIRTTQGELTIKRSLFSDNDVTTSSTGITGGAIKTLAGTVGIENSTFSGNDILAGADNAAGAALGVGGGTALLVHSTIAGQTVTGSGAAIYAANVGSVVLEGSIIEGDCVTGTTSPISAASDYNLLSDSTCNQGSGNSQVLPGDLGLAPGPAPNGGPTDTIALADAMPARDFVPLPSACLDLDGNPLSTDQRGAPRPYGDDCDAGAYEFSKCRGAVVNLVGVGGSQNFVGTPDPDGILGLGGADTLKGKAGEDGLCGGKGKDKLVGGADKDACDGGPGHDQASKSCERTKAVP